MDWLFCNSWGSEAFNLTEPGQAGTMQALLSYTPSLSATHLHGSATHLHWACQHQGQPGQYYYGRQWPKVSDFVTCFCIWVSKKTLWHVKIASKKHTDMPESHTKHMPLWHLCVFFYLSNMQIIYLGPLPTGQLLPLLSCHHLFCWLWCMTVFQLYFKQDTQKCGQLLW